MIYPILLAVMIVCYWAQVWTSRTLRRERDAAWASESAALCKAHDATLRFNELRAQVDSKPITVLTVEHQELGRGAHELTWRFAVRQWKVPMLLMAPDGPPRQAHYAVSKEMVSYSRDPKHAQEIIAQAKHRAACSLGAELFGSLP